MKTTLSLAVAALLSATNASLASTVNLGTLTQFSGGDAGEGLDLDGNIIYAFNLGGTAETVQGVDFAAAPAGAPPEGITTTGGGLNGPLDFDYTVTNGGNAADYGNSADDDALENITAFIWYDKNWTFDLAVVPGTQYQLQLILQEGWIGGQGVTHRSFDISVETASPSTLSVGLADLDIGMETNGAFQDGADFGLVYTYIFTAADDSFRVALDESFGTAVLTAVTLKDLGLDTTSPTISTLDPANDADGVPTFSDLVMTFDEKVGFGTGNITIKDSDGTVAEVFDVTTSPNLLLSGASVTINPSNDLADTTGYYVQIDATAIKDRSDNFFAGITDATTWNFTTGGADVTAPTVAALSPADDATGVAKDASLSVTFDENVVFGSGDIMLRTSGGGIVEAFDVTGSPNLLLSGATVTIDPTINLSAGTDYYVEIATTAIEDLAGNPFAGISGDTTWNFTSASNVPLGTLTPFTGGDAGEGLDLSGNIVYAFNLGGMSGIETVQGVDFVDAPAFDPPEGITTTGSPLDFDYLGTNGGSKAADYGDSADDDALENITNVIWYEQNWAFDLAVVPGVQYQLQLILQEGWNGAQGATVRNFDVSVETEPPSTLSLAIDDLVLGMETNGAFQDGADFGLVYTYTFTATDSSFRVALDDSPNGTDTLAVLTAVILQEVDLGGPIVKAVTYDEEADTFTISWESRAGRLYNLRSETGLSTEPASWPSFEQYRDLEATPPENILTIPLPDDPERFFVIEEFPAPPVVLFADDFESGQGEWTTGSDGSEGTAWELGVPSGVGPVGAHSPVNCFATNLSQDYTIDADVWLRSPVIDLTDAERATLRYVQFFDIEEGFDLGTVSVIDAADDSELAVLEGVVDGVSADWARVTKRLPAEALGKPVKLEFRLQSDDIGNFAGWYLDDVELTVP